MPQLTIQAPAGAHFEFEEVKTARGTKSLGEVPILVWETTQAAVGQYGEEGIVNVLDGTSLRVSFQGIARRLRLQGKSDDEIATAQLQFKPGSRVVGESTPVSRARNAAKAAAEKVDGDAIAAFLQKVAAGEISEADIKSFVQ
jgi:hypothetical protein